MSEALRAALEYGFGQMGLHRVSALVHPENRASIRLLERFAFQPEGRLRDYYYREGRYFDHLVFSLLLGDWKQGE